MDVREPPGELAARFSSPGATPRPWTDARRLLERAELFWLTTVRPDGRPHVTPLITVWVDDALYFCTGPDERKARNLAANRSCILTTGCNVLGEGLDVVVEGDAARVDHEAELQRVADIYAAKYGDDWTFTVSDGAFHHDDGGTAVVFRVVPTTVFGFGKGEPFSQTRYRFSRRQAGDSTIRV